MSSDETNRDQQATTELPAGPVGPVPHADPPTEPRAAAAAEPPAPAEPGPATAPTEVQGVTPGQLAEAVRAQGERSETLRGDLGQGTYAAQPEIARETNPTGAPRFGEPVPPPGVWARPALAGPVPAGPHTPPPFYPGPPQNQFPPAFQPQPPKRMGTVPKVLVGTVAALVLALGSGTVGGLVGFALGDQRGGTTISTSTGRAVSNGGSLADVAERAQASVVGVKTGSGQGSGVVFNADGHILTNNHVVAGANGGLSVTFSDGKTVAAKLVGTDPTNDLAVLKVDGVDGLTPITFGDSDAIKIGDPVLAIGNPLGLDGTVTAGIISAKNRTITEGGDQSSPYERPAATNRLSGLLQTDAAINPGNSGGALINAAGHLMGINTAIATSGNGSTGNIGVGFAIPSNKAKSIADQLMRSGKVGHPYIGVQVANSDTAAGAVLSVVEPDSPAAKAGLVKGDRVTSVNGKTVKNSDELVSAVQAGSPGDKLTLTVVRDGRTTTVSVTVGEKQN